MIKKYDDKMMAGAYGAYRATGAHGTNGTNGAYGANGAFGRTFLFLISYFLFIICGLFGLCGLAPASAQVRVGGNIYGGGNQGNVEGSTTVKVQRGDLNKVFGGARMANVGGNSYVNIDGANATGFTVINYVYGGNDIAGTIGTARAVGESLPAQMAGNKDGVDDTWNTYVHISAKTTTSTTYYTAEEAAAYNTANSLSEGDPGYKTTNDIKTRAVVDPTNKKIYIGQLFAGGNGDYTYTDENGNPLTDGEGNYIVKSGDQTVATRATAFNVPEVAKSYLDVQGGSIVYAYGGGNNATVTEKTVIHVDNPTAVVNEVKVNAETGLEDNEAGVNILTNDRFRYDMGINTGFSFPSSGAFQIGRFFGGNNRAEMDIRPTWNLQAGKIRNLYSGGNRGAMTSPEGLLLEIPASSTIVVDNLYGGCRMADVCPKVDGIYTPTLNLPGYNFPNELSARVLVRGGDINNIYGGNDVTGKVYGGNAVGIHTSIRGDIYGGGNGAYPYTDNPELFGDDIYGDFYYENQGTVDALNAFRPNAEQVSIHLVGTNASHPTIIKGSVFCGGNCATIQSVKENPMLELKIGSYVVADNVYLGNNGAQMVHPTILETFATNNSLNLTDRTVFAGYMDGVVMRHNPAILFDSRSNGDQDDYVDNSSYIGSFYCGGNVGSMAIAGKNTYQIASKLNIFNKFVGGCNNADVAAGTYNAAYQGGVIGVEGERGTTSSDHYTDTGAENGHIKDRLEIDLSNLTITPLRWNADSTELVWNTHKWEEYARIATGKVLAVGDEYYTKAGEVYTKHTVEGSAYTVLEADEYYATYQGFAPCDRDPSDDNIRVLDGNVYGGCYNSGHVNGNVTVNINEDILKRDAVFGEADINGNPGAGISYEDQRDDVNAVALTVFGAGCGKDTEIWGSATVNLNKGYAFQVFGGGEEGVVGKKNDEGNYVYDARYSTTVNLKGTNAGYSMEQSGPALAEAEYLYGGGNEGDVCGDTYVNLGNGRFYDAFGGACNADIYGAAEVTVGYNGGFPWSLDNIYGGNDFGGTIRGIKNHTSAVLPRTAFDPEMLKSSTYVKYIQGRVDTIFGGNYGCYDYTDRIYKDYTDAEGHPLVDGSGNPIFSYPSMADNSFVHFTPADNASNHVGIIFGGSSGFPGNVSVNNSMQPEAYVLMDDTDTKDADRFANVDIYGGGAFAGVGIPSALGAGRAAIDLYAGSYHDVYGGCNREGLIGYTRVNVPESSTVKLQSIFGGGQGYSDAQVAATSALASRYCDNYVTCIDYQSSNAIVEDAIYGGNRNRRIAADTYVSIDAPVLQSNGYQATIYGGGYGTETVSGRTNVFMNNGSVTYKTFGGGRDGNVLNFVSLKQWLASQFRAGGVPVGDVPAKVTEYAGILSTFATYIAANPVHLPSDMGTYPNPSTGEYDGTYTNDLLTNPRYYNTNVHLMDGSNVSGYAYGGGFGSDAVIAGTTYIELKGGTVDRDIYGGGQGGSVYDEYGLINDEDDDNDFVATTNVYIEGGMVRNVYGGGYLGHVGWHEGDINTVTTGDIPAVANVTIGKVDGTSFYDGIPAIMRNAYGGGEGGSVYGTANLTINNGYIGYRYKNMAAEGQTPNYQYVEELDDKKPNAIVQAGNAFGGGYVVNSYVDNANVTMYGGTLRGSLYGGGELGPIGAGTTKTSYSSATGVVNGNVRIFRPGKTLVQVYDGHVKRNVFGGGRGHDSWGGDGTLYMDDDVVASLNANGLFCKGYIFGQTEVDIYGGEIGTDEGVASGYGNVFGGSDIGSVYSAYKNESGALSFGKKSGTRYDGLDNSEGYYYKYENGAYQTSESEYILTEDCKVVVEPWCKAIAEITISDSTFAAGAYVPTSYLNYLGSKNGDKDNWSKLAKDDVNKEGIIIHNAVFAGGNTSPGSTEVYANTTTVFGNASASVHDVYHRDLISIGKGRVGGLYGDGNLTLIDGYRELNITNYGTDYYHISSEITKAEYDALPKREAAYYEIRYRCISSCTDDNGKTYAKGSTITSDEMQAVFRTKNNYQVLIPIVDGEGNPVLGEDGYPTFDEGSGTTKMLDEDGKPNTSYWVENGVCSRYAGRPMNTIQRADFCGVFGSRMVMQGAQDRVPETVDYTNYTINRVREVSLNKKVSLRDDDLAIASTHPDYYRHHIHGNYFGIYSVVNFLGALTSDVDFHTAVRVTDNKDTDTYQADAKGKKYGTATYYEWKDQFHDDRRRNNGNSHNKVALASGVYLELTSEKGTGKGLYEKDWGLITGVVELDLINVQTGMGGGYVYAKNAHGIRSNTVKTQTILTALNTGAASNKRFQYDETDDTKKEWETSGNFVHSTQTIIDDCYDQGGKYLSGYNKPDGVPAHYWFIKGAVYIYDQYISAFTGSANAFSETVNIPLSITSASHGRLTLMNVQPGRYAYYSSNNEGGTATILGEGQKVELRDAEYQRNDAINYWEYSTLAQNEKNLFVDETYVVTADCELDGVPYAAGKVLLPDEYTSLKESAPKKDLDETDGIDIVTPYVHHVAKDEDVDFDFVFRPSNNVGHDTGYILTYQVNNPSQWNTWYTPKNGAASDKNQTGGAEYEDGPTYTPNTTGLYGQQEYSVGSIIDQDTYNTYQTVVTNHSDAIPSGQATFYPAYIVQDDILETTNKQGTAQRFHQGATLAAEDYASETWATLYDAGDVAHSSVAPAYVVTSTIQLSKTEFVYRNTYMTEAERTELYNTYKDGTAAEKKMAADILKNIVPAYYCTKAGLYGGNYYETGHNYRALAAYSAMSKSDRAKFTFNYDALDLLIDPEYGRSDGVKYQYDGKGFTSIEQARTNKAAYSLQTPIDYTATYKGVTKLSYKADNGSDTDTDVRAELTRTEYESLPNERQNYTAISVTETGTPYYVVRQTVVMGDTPYATGQVIDSKTYSDLSDTDKLKVVKLEFSSTGYYYYCHTGYTINTDLYSDENKGKVTTATGITVTDGTSFTGGTEYTTAVPAGIVIGETSYLNVINQQSNFAIHGLAPTETSTLYVARGADINDLSAEKIITAIYKYDYVESDMAGMHITPVTEYHVLNIHLNFKSGVPTVDDIQAPDIVLPGTSVSIPEPYVTPGAYEITGGGWMLFDTERDAESHINGVEYTPISDPLYLYQNKNYLAYYVKTYLGKTFSNHVPVRVANYHDLKKVMDDKDNHYYIDHKDIFERLKVEPKIYINNYSGAQDGLDLFKQLYDLSVLSSPVVDPATGLISSGTFEGHKPLKLENVHAGNNLEFFLRTDITHPDNTAVANEWTPIGSSAGTCFEGTLHGDGHTISGIDNSLFNHLCGDVFNLGVQGSFTGAGIAETGGGYVENCWISTSSTAAKTSKPVFNAPNRSASDKETKGAVQLVNSYYMEEDGAANKYTNHASESDYGLQPVRKPARAFYNGEVAYDLNGFYLYKRYCDDKVSSGTDDQKYYYYTIDAEDKVQLQTPKYYATNAKYSSSGNGSFKYVEKRFADGDFRYAVGEIPDDEDERYHEWTYTDPETSAVRDTSTFYPIWPDDYLFFGQKLTYGYSATQAHNATPTSIARFNGRLSKTLEANRVYRAPAYYRSSVMGVAHFNPNAYLAAKSKDGSKEAYPNMTAIDFAGHHGTNEVNGTYGLGNETGMFYTPLLDDDGLLSIVNQDETKNLLVYAPAASGEGYTNAATNTVLTSYFVDPEYDSYYDNSDNYRLVGSANDALSSIYGHLVPSTLTATSDHLLVDKQDFNAPIEYSFDGSHRMWYQRMPDNYVEPVWTGEPATRASTRGWEGVSLPFVAELVTTDDKGEITHFYSGSASSKNGTGSKIGHEYWLRECTNIIDGEPAVASFLYPTATGDTKNVTNTFLWDYYYENTLVHNRKDANKDTYQEYYSTNRTYANYPLLTGGKPYIIGFPGDTYYEFDLSGNFEAANTAAAISKLGQQTITFASNAGATIHVSDTEMTGDSYNGYSFKPSYMKQSIAAGTTAYTMSAAGDSYDKVPDAPGLGDPAVPDTQVEAFRPYFTAVGGGVKKNAAKRILFSGGYNEFDEDEPNTTIDGDLIIYAQGHAVIVKSYLKEPATVRIISVGGITLKNFVIQPGQTIETPINTPGIYIVNKKKLSIN